MSIEIQSEGIRWPNHEVLWKSFVSHQQKHREHCPNTGTIEDVGRNIVAEITRGVPQDFIQSVCTWGGYPGIAGRVRNRNTPEHIQEQFAKALDALGPHPMASNYVPALVAVNAIRELGTPSFASKHLRMLRPDACGVLDKLVSESTKYSNDASGFAEYSGICVQIAATLNKIASTEPTLLNRLRPKGEWLAGDVDAVVFAEIRNWA
jgi:hypothetical protein